MENAFTPRNTAGFTVVTLFQKSYLRNNLKAVLEAYLEHLQEHYSGLFDMPLAHAACDSELSNFKVCRVVQSRQSGETDVSDEYHPLSEQIGTGFNQEQRIDSASRGTSWPQTQ